MLGRRKNFKVTERASTVERLLGVSLQEFTGCTSVPAVEGVAGAPALITPLYNNRRFDSDKTRDKRKFKPPGIVPKMRDNVVSGILGKRKVSESDEYARSADERFVIPDDATPLKTVQTGMQSKPEPESSNTSAREELISPSAALVAPDTTPDALVPLDPSQVPPMKTGAAPPVSASPVPEPPGVLDVVLGREEPQPALPEHKKSARSFDKISNKMSMMDFMSDSDRAALQENKNASKQGNVEETGMKNYCNLAREYFS